MNENFYSFWVNNKSNAILKGGRSSMKSSVISLKLLIDFLKDPQGNVVVLRKVKAYLSTSVYQQISWAIMMLKLENEFYFGKAPLVIRHKKTGTAFYFYGCDDPMKIKSAKIAKGYVMSIWFEELAEFDGVEDIDIVQDTFIRQDIGNGKEVKTYYSYNPPRNQYAWINEWVENKKRDDDYYIHHSTYMDDKKGILSKQQLRKIEKYRITDNEYWRWMYCGEVIGLGNMVYNMNHFHIIDELPSDDDIWIIDTAIDTGHQISATTFLALALTKKGNVILLDTYYYSPANRAIKKAPSELSEDYYNWRDEITSKYRKPIDFEIIDSAEGALRNQAFLDYNIDFVTVNKMKNIDMIDCVQDLLSQGRVFILNTDNNKIFIDEHKKYQWDEKSKATADPKVIKVADHCVDAFKYYVITKRQDLGLKL